jgi:hypothetical protein
VSAAGADGRGMALIAPRRRRSAGISILDTGFVLGLPEHTVRSLSRDGQPLARFANGRIDPESVRAYLTTLDRSAIRLLALHDIVAGLYVAPRPERRYAPPVSIDHYVAFRSGDVFETCANGVRKDNR